MNVSVLQSMLSEVHLVRNIPVFPMRCSEGDDDVLFWHEVFSKIPEASVEVESAGGSDQIDQYITKILSGTTSDSCERFRFSSPHGRHRK